MPVNIITFGKITEIAGNSFTIDDLPDTNALKLYLENTYPAIKNTRYVLAVNKQQVTENVPLPSGATVAILPPFSGG